MLLCQEFTLEKWDWFVRVFYVVDSLPIDFIINELRRIGSDIEDIDSALITLDKINSGITYSNLEQRKSVIVIGATSCPAEFANSYDHEKFHLAMHIAKTDKIDPFSENLAYLIGDIGYETFKIAKRFMCEHCREEIK